MVIKPELRNAVFFSVTIVGLVALMSGAIAARSKLTAIAQLRSQTELTSVISDTRQLVEDRYKQAQSSTSLLAASPVVVAATKAILEDGHHNRSYSTADVLEAYLSPLVAEQGFLGYAILSPDETFIAAENAQTEAQAGRFLSQTDAIKKALAGRTAITYPQFADPRDLIDEHGIQQSDLESMLVAPIRDENGRVLALLAVLFDLESEVEKLIRLGRFRDSGETIVFDSNGRILAKPRFDIAMHETVGLAEHKHALLQFPDYEKEQVKAQGEGLKSDSTEAARMTAREFVKRLQKNQVEGSVSNLYSYVSYHGERVLGVWYWDQQLGIGFSTEILEQDAVGNSVAVTMMVGLLAVIMLYILTILFLILRGDDAKADKKKSIAAIVNTVPDCILTVAADGSVLTANSHAEMLLGPIVDETCPVNLSKIVTSDGLIEGIDQDDRHNLDNEDGIDLDALEGRSLRCRAYHIDGTSLSAEILVSKASTTTSGDKQFTCIIRDISEKLKSEEAIHKLVFFDPLTGLANRNEFNRRLDDVIKEARRNDTLVSIMMLDLDRFKHINEAFGHDVGDRILQIIGERLRKTAREVDTVARISADEFVFVATGLENLQDATRPAERMLKVLSEPIEIDGYVHHVETSIGISFFPQDDENRAELVRKADIALYQAKQRGRGQIQFYDTRLDEKVRANKVLEDELRQAVKNRDLQLYYQPQVDLNGNIEGVEALLRWQREDGTFTSPETFVALAEYCNLIGEIGDWVLEEACRQAKAWLMKGIGPLRMAVNVSPVQFSDPRLIEKVENAVANADFDPRYLELEITESMVMSDVEQAIEKLVVFKEKGFSLAIDDFGTGHSSLAYLKDMPVDRLKIDKSFIDGIPENNGNLSIVSAVISLGQSMGLEVVAEGVETLSQWHELQRLGCDFVQGYYFAKPLAVADFEKWYAERGSSPAVDLQAKVRQSQEPT